ncbi:succinyl-CoA synthetase subunit beta [Burkholderia sp. H160]|nr:succinyl-CoA synthetase subunit beta [Burkholderia sp. H160]
MAPILGMQLVTHRSGPEGQKVKRLLIEVSHSRGAAFYI